jgi:hypothetical protein
MFPQHNTQREDITIWIATLSNGEIIYQNDNKPEDKEPSTWKRMKKYVEENLLSITQLSLQFRDHMIHLPISPIANYFAQGMMGELGKKMNHYYIFGYYTLHLKENYLKCNWYKIPELIITQTLDKTITPNLENFIIYNYVAK